MWINNKYTFKLYWTERQKSSEENAEKPRNEISEPAGGTDKKAEMLNACNVERYPPKFIS